MRPPLPGPLVYVDISEVRDGALGDLRPAIAELAEFIEASVPRILFYNVHLSEDGSEMTVIHAHPDSASLEQHLATGGPVFAKFAELIALKEIRVYGEPSAKALEALEAKARALGGTGARVVVQPQEAGFSRFGGT